MKITNKKNRGFLRIVEAVIAISLILGVMFVFYNRNQTQLEENTLADRADQILDEVARNVALREAVLTDSVEPLNTFISSKIPEQYLDFEARICNIGDACGKSEYTDSEVFSAERTISSTITIYNPKKVRLFIWERD